jgi:hypothetical protein
MLDVCTLMKYTACHSLEVIIRKQASFFFLFQNFGLRIEDSLLTGMRDSHADFSATLQCFQVDTRFCPPSVDLAETDGKGTFPYSLERFSAVTKIVQYTVKVLFTSVQCMFSSNLCHFFYHINSFAISMVLVSSSAYKFSLYSGFCVSFTVTGQLLLLPWKQYFSFSFSFKILHSVVRIN